MKFVKAAGIFLSLLCTFRVNAQPADLLNTAKNCGYMKPEEREMIREINLLRSNPAGYLKFIQPLLNKAQATLRKQGKGYRNYSLTISTTTVGAKVTTTTDTTWHYSNDEEVKALQSLIKDLKKMKPLSILEPDSGIYNAVKYYGADQDKHAWNLHHTGSDGSLPWDRITRFSPKMSTGNENIAGHYPMASPKEIVIQLLVDSGIPGYGHRYNLLDKQWTHAACYSGGLNDGIYRWLQNFGAEKR
jgi:uncharacterized protein YkwD